MRCAVLSCFSHVRLFATLWTTAHQASLAMGFSRQEYRSGLLCPPLGDLPNPGIELESLMSPALADRFFTTSAPREAHKSGNQCLFNWWWPLLASLRPGLHLCLIPSLSQLKRSYICHGHCDSPVYNVSPFLLEARCHASSACPSPGSPLVSMFLLCWRVESAFPSCSPPCPSQWAQGPVSLCLALGFGLWFWGRCSHLWDLSVLVTSCPEAVVPFNAAALWTLEAPLCWAFGSPWCPQPCGTPPSLVDFFYLVHVHIS